MLLDTDGVLREELELTPAAKKECDRTEMPPFSFPGEITWATVHKDKEGGRVVAVNSQVVLGSAEQAQQTLQASQRSQTINTSFVERYHGTQRQFNARKKRKAYTFSKELSWHAACTWLVVVWYNFGWCVRTLREQVQKEPPRYHYRTPAMAAGLTDHAWTMHELLCYPLYPPKDDPQRSKLRTYKDVLERLESVLATKAPT